MVKEGIIEVLKQVRDGNLSIGEALEKISSINEEDKKATKVRVTIINQDTGKETVNIVVPLRWAKWIISAIPHRDRLEFGDVKMTKEEFISNLEGIKGDGSMEIEFPEKKIRVVLDIL